MTEIWKPSSSAVSLQASGAPYCLAYDDNDDFSSRVNGHVERVLQYMKKPVKTIGPGAPLDGCSAVIASVS
ncbi:hypothetical protein ABTC94_20185, partial [Acinetobacter baumannii]